MPPRNPRFEVPTSILNRAGALLPLYIATWLAPPVVPGAVAPVVWPYSTNGTSVP